MQITRQILGIVFFSLAGIFLSYIIFPKTDIIKRAVYSVVLAVSISTILGVLLYLLGILTSITTILSLIFLTLLFIILKSKKQCKTEYNPDIRYLLLFSLIGAIWRLWFWKSIKNPRDTYGYAFKFIGETVPDLGFYTGMARDRANYVGLKTTNALFNFFSLNNQYINTFLITFIFLGFIYLIFCKYRNKKLAYIGVALTALGPIELFHMTSSITGHALSYISLFPLFLLFKSKHNRVFWLALVLAITMMFTYHTASMTMLLSSIGFIIALFIKDLIKTKNIKIFKNSLKNRKIQAFLLITIVLTSYICIFSNMEVYTIGRTRDLSSTKESFSRIKAPTVYKDPAFLGLSAIRWQMLFFFLCGLTFVFHIAREIIKKKGLPKDSEDIYLLLCLIPISIISYGFIHVNLQPRIFDYFAFFGLLALKIPKKYLRIFFILSFIFILITSFYVARDKRIFFETSDKEIKGAREIANSLQGRIFSDQPFINQLILNGYYNVTGTYDKEPLLYNLFYQDNSSAFLNTINTLNSNLGVSYIALTKRMQEQYILMLNYPKKPLTNIELYEENLEKVYDNGDVRVYKIKPQ